MATYYVRTDGHDTASGANPTNNATTGAFLTIGKLASVVAAGDTGVICADGAATYTLTSTVTWSTAGGAATPITITGGNSSGTVDGTRPTVTSATNSVNLFTIAASNLTFQNLTMTHTAGTRGAGFFSSAADRANITIYRCVIDGCATGIDGDYTVGFTFLNLVVSSCEIKNCTNHGISAPDAVIDCCYIHDNTNDGVRRGAFTSGQYQIAVVNSILSTNAKNVHYSADIAGFVTVAKSVLRNSTGDNLYLNNGTAAVSINLRNNILYAAGAYNLDSAAAPAGSVQLNNAFKVGSSGNRNNIPAGTGDVTLSGDPFTNAASGDYSLNNTAGAGAACRAAGFPGVMLAGGTGYGDIGALQHQDAGGSAGMLYIPSLEGV